MSQAEIPNQPDLRQEVSQLRADLQLKDQLVEQLSRELHRVLQDKAHLLLPQSDPSELEQVLNELLREQLVELEQQVIFYQEQISKRDAEIHQLRQSVQGLTQRNQTLASIVQELPQIYRQKFAERIEPIKARVEKLQQENWQLRSQLKNPSYSLAVKSRRNSTQIDLPEFTDHTTGSISTFGNG